MGHGRRKAGLKSVPKRFMLAGLLQVDGAHRSVPIDSPRAKRGGGGAPGCRAHPRPPATWQRTQRSLPPTRGLGARRDQRLGLAHLTRAPARARRSAIMAEVTKSTYFAVWWLGLGILSSVGLGSGMHTGFLFMFPHVFKVVKSAEQDCGLDFDTCVRLPLTRRPACCQAPGPASAPWAALLQAARPRACAAVRTCGAGSTLTSRSRACPTRPPRSAPPPPPARPLRRRRRHRERRAAPAAPGDHGAATACTGHRAVSLRPLLEVRPCGLPLGATTQTMVRIPVLPLAPLPFPNPPPTSYTTFWAN